MPLDVLNYAQFKDVISSVQPRVVLHLASLLSVTGERFPERALAVNTEGALNLLRLASWKDHGGFSEPFQVFIPSSIAAYGPASGRVRVPETSPMDPYTIYGITKCHVEHLLRYYHRKYAVDARSLRYPGVLSARAPPGGGVTDWAVEMLRAAVSGQESYTCFLRATAAQPMVHVRDLVNGTMRYLAAPSSGLHSIYNIQALSFSPRDLELELRTIFPRFRVRYAPDERQVIADTWPESLDDAMARDDWGWDPRLDSLPMLVATLVKEFTKQLAVEETESAEAPAPALKDAEASQSDGAKKHREEHVQNPDRDNLASGDGGR